MRKGPEDNLFVKILNGEIPSHEVFQDEHTYSFLDIYPQAKGHTLVIPKSYSPNAFEATPEDLQHCWSTVRKLMPAIKAATGALGISVLTNTGKDAGQMVEYLHFHIIPRYPADSVSMSKLGDAADQDELGATAKAIREALG